MDANSTVKLRTGRHMPVIGLGTWQLKNDTPAVIKRALQVGYKMIDTSGDYGTQPGIGQGLRDSGINREDFYLVTKVEEDEDSYQAVLKNLAELDIDYADLILIHRPPKTGVGEDLWEGLRRARDEGLSKDIGVSNYSVNQIQELAEQSGEVPVVNQIEWSPFGHDTEMFDFCRKNDIIIQAYSPLTRSKRLHDERLGEIAVNYGKSPAQILIRWNMQLGTVPLPKANQIKHLEENIEVFDFELTKEDMNMLSGFNERYSALGKSLQYLQS